MDQSNWLLATKKKKKEKEEELGRHPIHISCNPTDWMKPLISKVNGMLVIFNISCMKN
jgi:hypothetical protein